MIGGVSWEIVEGVTAVKVSGHYVVLMLSKFTDIWTRQVGGHFPGSLVLHWDKKLFIADSLVTAPVSG